MTIWIWSWTWLHLVDETFLRDLPVWRERQWLGKSSGCRWRCLEPTGCWSAPGWLEWNLLYEKYSQFTTFLHPISKRKKRIGWILAEEGLAWKMNLCLGAITQNYSSDPPHFVSHIFFFNLTFNSVWNNAKFVWS